MDEASSLTEIRAQILRQHVEIRARLRGIERLAKACHAAEARRHLHTSLTHFAAVFDEHLGFEERTLEPIVRAVDAWGTVRADAMLAEHAEQRQRVERAAAFAEDGEITHHELEGELHWLAQSLLSDMTAEETALAALETLDVASTQMTG